MHSFKDKRSDFMKNMHFGAKKIFFQEFSNFSESFGLSLLVPLAFWELLIWTSCSSCLKMISKGPLTQKIISKFESITDSVEQMENKIAHP